MPREIGKLAPYLWYKGCLSSRKGKQVAVTRGERLFNKNVADCKSERMSTVCDACPVLVCDYLVQQGEAPVNGGGNSDRRKVA